MVEALGITVDRRPKRRPRKNGKLNHRKIGCAPIWIAVTVYYNE